MNTQKKMSFKEAAVEILRKANEPLSAIEIATRATQEGLIQTTKERKKNEQQTTKHRAPLYGQNHLSV
jgi:hypothetical protein